LRNTLGIQGETRAVEYLSQQNYKILARNYRAKRLEIDIVAQDLETSELVICEVKTRSKNLHLAGFSINAQKQQNIRKAYQYFVSQFPAYSQYQPRFDAILVEELDLKQFEIIQIKNAF
jgi:putative endonuclease